jgi:preprotein translocase subunit SecA
VKGEDPDLDGLAAYFESKYGVRPEVKGENDRGKFEEKLVDWAEKQYAERERVLGKNEVRDRLEGLSKRHLLEKASSADDAARFCHAVQAEFGVAVDVPEVVRRSRPETVEYALGRIVAGKRENVERVGHDLMRMAERHIVLSKIDEKWKDCLYNIDQLRDIIGLRSYAQADPKLEYKRDATAMFGAMMEAIEEDTTSLLFRMQQVAVDSERLARRWTQGQESKADVKAFSGGQEGEGEGEEDKPKPIVSGPKTGRNEPCPCGSGKKYKRCHGLAGAPGGN